MYVVKYATASQSVIFLGVIFLKCLLQSQPVIFLCTFCKGITNADRTKWSLQVKISAHLLCFQMNSCSQFPFKV